MTNKTRTSDDPGKHSGGDDGEQPDFETALQEVEQIVAKLESGDAGLTESLEYYETGIKRLKQCHTLLSKAERRITLLSGFDADGNPVSEPFDSDDTKSKPSKGRTRSKRPGGSESKSRSKPAKGSPSQTSSDSAVDGPPGLF